jgi:pantoate--beta-alanine ligase
MQTAADPGVVNASSERVRARGGVIGFVPTMGFLHEGHRSLMRMLRPRVDHLVVSVYVNPLQFAPNEDFAAYPRDPDGDAAACAAEGVDLVFAPTELYPPGFVTRVSVPALDRGLCSVARPTHFTGVATVVHRLFRVVRPHVAAFGQKDYQQLAVIRAMVRDLDLGIEVLGGPIVREPDGLAMSSRNAYLSPSDRARAASLSRALSAIQAAHRAGQVEVAALVAIGRAALDVDAVDYLEIVDPVTLEPLTDARGPARAAIAAVVGRTRLLDNAPLGGEA